MTDFEFMVQVSKQNWKPFAHFPNSEGNHLIFGATFRVSQKIESGHLPVEFPELQPAATDPQIQRISAGKMCLNFSFFLDPFQLKS